MTDRDIDIELLIEEVRRHPELWDVSSEDYKNKNKKTVAWIEVCSTLIPDFETKEEAIKNALGKTIMGRWRNVRDNFIPFKRKITKSGQAAENGRRYIYARQLDFLMGTRENIPTEASFQAEEEDAEADNEEPLARNTDEIPGPSRMVQGFTPDQKGLLSIQSQHEMQHFHSVTQPTPIRSHTQLQNSDHFSSSLFTSQRPSQTQTFTSVPQRSPLPSFSPDLASPSSQSQHSSSTYDYDLYSQQ